MTGEQSFFGKVGSNFSESARERSMLATSWYNQYFRPRVELQDEDAHWFSYRARINPTSFKSKACIIDDCLKIVGNPAIYTALAALELARIPMCAVALGCCLAKLDFEGGGMNLLQIGESIIAFAGLAAMAAIEEYFQMASFAIRVGVTVMDWVKPPENTGDPEAQTSESEYAPEPDPVGMSI
jgi:hypothetical protein